jgi:hypothetical protein
VPDWNVSQLKNVMLDFPNCPLAWELEFVALVVGLVSDIYCEGLSEPLYQIRPEEMKFKDAVGEKISHRHTHQMPELHQGKGPAPIHREGCRVDISGHQK